MSTAVMALCWPLTMPPTPKAVLISLADQANDQGACWPSIAGISQRTCFGRTAVIEALKWLEDQDYLRVEKSGGRNNRYALNLTKLKQRDLTSPPAEPVREADQSGKRTGEPVRQPNQSGKRTSPGAVSTSPPAGPPPVREADQPVRQADPNRQEPSEEPSQTGKGAGGAPSAARTLGVRDLVKLGVEQQHAADWLKVRTAKRLPLTQTAWEGVCAEADRAGIPPAMAVKLSAEQSWGGFRASWLTPEHMTAAKAGPGGDWKATRQSIEAKGEALGLGRWDQKAWEAGRGVAWPLYVGQIEKRIADLQDEPA